MTVGLIATATAGVYHVGFVDPSTGSFIGTPGITTVSGTQWLALELRVSGDFASATNRVVQLYQSGVLVQQSAYAITGFPTTTNTDIRFGCNDTAVQNVSFQVKQVNWYANVDIDYNNCQVSTGSFSGNLLVDSGANNLFVSGDVGRTVRIHDFTVTNASHGNARGEWQISSFTDANTVALIGPQRRGATFDGGLFPHRMTVRGDPRAFIYPDNLGQQLVIESGPNAGTYTIARLLDPGLLTDLAAAFPGSVPQNTAATTIVTIPTNVVEITGSFPAPSDLTEVTWHILPTFPTDAGPFPYEIVDTSTVSGTTVTLRQALPIGITGSYTPLVDALYTTVLSAQTEDLVDHNTLVSPGVYHLYPFYLSDNWGFIRDLMSIVHAAGVYVDFDSLFRDSSGLHIQG